MKDQARRDRSTYLIVIFENLKYLLHPTVFKRNIKLLLSFPGLKFQVNIRLASFLHVTLFMPHNYHHLPSNAFLFLSSPPHPQLSASPPSASPL